MVGVVRGGDVGDVDAGVGEQLLVGAVRGLDPEVTGEGLGPGQSREATATTRCAVERCSAVTNRCAIQPGPITPHRSGGAAIGSGVRAAGGAVGNFTIAPRQPEPPVSISTFIVVSGARSAVNASA